MYQSTFGLAYTADGRALIVRDAVMPRINIVDAGSGEILHQIPGADGVRPTTDPSCLVGFFDDHTIGWYDLPHDARIGTGVDPGFDIRDFLVIGARVLVWPFDGPLLGDRPRRRDHQAVRRPASSRLLGKRREAGSVADHPHRRRCDATPSRARPWPRPTSRSTSQWSPAARTSSSEAFRTGV